MTGMNRELRRHAQRSVALTAFALACSTAEGSDPVRAVALPVSMELDVAIVPDVSGSMAGRARLDFALPQLDTISAVVARHGGGILVIVITDDGAHRMVSVQFDPVPEAPPTVALGDTTGPFRQADYQRAEARRRAEHERRVAVRDSLVARQRVAFLLSARPLLERPVRPATSSPVCQALADVNAFMARPRRSARPVLRVALLESDIIATDRAPGCPASLDVDVVLQLADPSPHGVRLAPRPQRAFSLADVLAVFPVMRGSP